jgi:hypothetical protein
MSATQISAKDVAELRARTGAGMMDCKKALEEANGDMNAAVDILRKKGIAKADKRADRAASEGQIVIWTSADASVAAMIEAQLRDRLRGPQRRVRRPLQAARRARGPGRLGGRPRAVGAEGAYLSTPWSLDKGRPWATS